MNVWEWLGSAADAVKQRSPDVSPVTNACQKGYSVTRAAAEQAGGAAVTKAREVQGYLSDDQVRGNIATVGKSLSINAGLFLARSYGGGPVIDFVSRSLRDEKVDSQKERLKELESKVAELEKELKSNKVTQLQSKLKASSADQSPEDVLDKFMVHHFYNDKPFWNALIIPFPGAVQQVKDKPSSK